jgi:hypothetical protein
LPKIASQTLRESRRAVKANRATTERAAVATADFSLSARPVCAILLPTMKELVPMFIRTITAGLLAVAPALVAQQLPSPTNVPQPRITFSETSHDFGKVKNTDTLKHEFIVTNTGTTTLEITAVQPGCGCTMAGQWDRQVALGMTGKIPLQLNPANFNGPIAKSITVTCNDPTHPTQYLQLHADVVRALDVQPQYLSFMPVEGEETTETRTVRITNNQEADLVIGDVRSSNPAFKTEVKSVRPGKEFELQITYAGIVSNTPQQGIIQINIVSNPLPLTVTVMAVPQSPFVTGPPVLYLPAGSLPPQFNSRSLTINYNSRTPVTLSEPAVNVEGATIQLQETTPGRTYTLNVMFPSGFQVQAGRMVEAAVKTSHPKYPVLKVPIIQPLPAVAAPPVAPGRMAQPK